jgi:transposase InsO family protein
VVDFVNYWTGRFDCITAKLIISSLNIYPARFHQWKKRYGTVNRHNGKIPRHHWLFQDEKDAIISFYLNHQTDGYRRCAYMMLDQDVACCSPSTVYRVLAEANAIRRWNRKPSKKGDGFEQPLKAHEHWHTDISYINVGGTFYYLITLLDGFSRYIVHTEIRNAMTELDVQVVIQRALELFPGETPRIISDNGKQFVSRDFKELIRIHGMTHVRTSPYYPQSNGKIERWHKTIKVECIRPGCALNVEDAKRLVGKYVKEYNEVRLHSAIGYVTPKDKLKGRAEIIHRERDSKLEQGRLARIQRSKTGRTHKIAI